MRKFLLWAVAIVVLAPIVFTAATIGRMQLNPALPGPAAEAALVSGDAVRVSTDDDWLVFEPQAPAGIGVVFYPGANCDVRGYAPVLRALAEAGYTVVGVQMPLRLSLLAADAADEVPPAFPEIERWILMGHSMGGAVGGGYVHDHPEAVAGAILLDAYPLESDSLADAGVPVWHVHRARPDGTPSAKFVKMRHVYPADSTWVPIPGGNHMQFGSFVGGTYDEEWPAEIDEAAQLELVKAAVLDAARAIAATG